MTQKWGVWCEIWGGATGYREGWLRSNGRIYVFNARDQADAVAKHLNDKPRPYATAEFSYTARPL